MSSASMTVARIGAVRAIDDPIEGSSEEGPDLVRAGSPTVENFPHLLEEGGRGEVAAGAEEAVIWVAGVELERIDVHRALRTPAS